MRLNGCFWSAMSGLRWLRNNRLQQLSVFVLNRPIACRSQSILTPGESQRLRSTRPPERAK